MKKNESEILSEVYAYLKLIGDNYIKKLPEDKYRIIVEEKDDKYNPQYTLEDFNDNCKTKEETRYIILLFYLEYWCESEEIKKCIVAKLNENERKLNDKYDPFRNKRKKDETSNTDEISNQNKERDKVKTSSTEKNMIKYKESFISKIKKFLKIKKKR